MGRLKEALRNSTYIEVILTIEGMNEEHTEIMPVTDSTDDITSINKEDLQ